MKSLHKVTSFLMKEDYTWSCCVECGSAWSRWIIFTVVVTLSDKSQGQGPFLENLLAHLRWPCHISALTLTFRSLSWAVFTRVGVFSQHRCRRRCAPGEKTIPPSGNWKQNCHFFFYRINMFTLQHPSGRPKQVHNFILI